MERRGEPPGLNPDGGFNTPICEEDLEDEEHLPYHQFSYDKQTVSMFSMNAEKCCRLAAVILALFAAVLLIVNIGLGVYYNKLTDSHLTLDDTERIGKEMAKLKETYKTAIEIMNRSKKQMDKEMSLQTQTKWEFEHQSRTGQDYKVQLDQITSSILKLRTHFPMIRDGCKYCPPGWIWMNSACFYFPFSDSAGVKSWQKAREFCQLHEGDLVVIDSKDKENSTVSHLLNYHDPSKSYTGFWIGLRDSEEEGTWKWLDGSWLLEGYWDDGEPNDANNADCAAVYAKENFFKAWKDNRCGNSQKWICEKEPTPIS